MKKYLTLYYLILLLAVSHGEDVSATKKKFKIPVKIAREGEDLSKADVFVATNEWQPVKPSQTVPRGLHIRMNLETGNVEAKLLDKDEAEKPANSAVVHVKNKEEEKDQQPGQQDLQYDSEELKELLKKIKGDNVAATEEKSESFRSYEEIKQDLADLNFSVKTDYEIMKNLVGKYQNATEASELAAILHDLEYYIHQFDNALDFVKLGGFRNLILPSLNSTDDELRSTAAFLVGSSSQSNPKVQIAALELGLVPQLLRTISNDPSFKVKSSALYALSCISRHFPLAQQEIIHHGGLSALASIFDNDSAEALKLQVKIVTLFYDFMDERNEPEGLNNLQRKTEAELTAEKKRQYEAMNMEQALLEQGFCRLITKLLDQLNPADLAEKHDSVEKVAQAMMSFVRLCRREFNDSIPQLKKLVAAYRDLSRQELIEESNRTDGNEADSYYTDVFRLLESLFAKLIHKDEL